MPRFYRKRTRRIYDRRPKFCGLCRQGTEPDYKEVLVLRRFLTDRGKILARSRSGVCAKHQRRLGREIKRARNMALLPFVRQL